MIGAGGLATLTDEDDPGAAGASPLGGFLYEPDGAVIRAGLVTAVAAGVEGGLLDEHIAYVTSDASRSAPRSPAATRCSRSCPTARSSCGRRCASAASARLTIKKRGVDVVPDQLRKRLALTGDAEATIVLTRVAGHGTALLVRPL